MRKTLILLMSLCLILVLFTLPVSAEEGIFKADKTYIVLMPGNFTDNGIWKVAAEDGYTRMLGGVNSKGDTEHPATMNITLPKDGTYRIYSFSKDFDAQPGTRGFQVKIGDAVAADLGTHGKAGWHWQATAPMQFLGGDQKLQVVDNVGYFARIAALVITDDLDFKWGESPDDIKALSAKQYEEGDVTYTPTPIENRPESEIAVRLNGEWMNFDVDPMLINDRTMVPFRAIFEALGCEVSWNEFNQTAIGERNGIRIELPIGDKNVVVGNTAVTLDQPAELINSRTLVPLRFVSEALGAQVHWNNDAKVVSILATIPEESIFFTRDSFMQFGTWISETDAADTYSAGGFLGLQSADDIQHASSAGAEPAIAKFEVEGGTYNVWVHSKDYAEKAPGTRYFQVAFNDQPMMEHKFGTHGGNGYAWACGGTVTLPAGVNTLYVHDTSGFYARFDGVFLTKDLDYVPSNSYEAMTRIAAPYQLNLDMESTAPAYAIEQNTPIESYSIENEYQKVVFYKVPTSGGQVIQNEIYAMSNGQWVLTKARNEALAYTVIRADDASYTIEKEAVIMKATFQYQGEELSTSSFNPFNSGVPVWYVPNDYVVNGNEVTLFFPAKDYGTMQATWSFDDEKQVKVSVNTTFAQDGHYSIGVSEGGSFAKKDVEYALAPFRVMYKRIPDNPRLISEQFLFTPMGTYTLYANNKYSESPVTKGVVLDPSWIPLRWVYADNNLFGISMRNGANDCQGVAFAPVMGSLESKFTAGSTYNMDVRIISEVSEWFGTYQNLVTGLFDVKDYRKNYVVSLNDAIFNTRDLLKDDFYSGWDNEVFGHYNIEYKSTTSNGNPMQAMQDYLLSEDEDMLTRRAIPNLVNTLTRGYIHFYKSQPSPVGSPVSGFNLNVIGGIYDMTRGTVPYLHQYGLEIGKTAVNNQFGNIAPFANDLSMYKYTGEQQYLDAAIQKADAYLEDVVYKEQNEFPDWLSFIFASYPNLANLIDIYEATGDEKYLAAAEDVAHWLTTALWVPGMDDDKQSMQITVNDVDSYNVHTIFPRDTVNFFWMDDVRYRIGPGTDTSNMAEHDARIMAMKKDVDAWIPSRVGLGAEAGYTFRSSCMIVMSYFAGDFMKLAAYTGNDYYEMIARNTIIGRYNSYGGYYREGYLTYPVEIDYPREGPDYTGIYWHHIPPFLAILEDFLFNQTYAWSGQNIEFPSVRQQGYAYFNSNQYGFESGKFYDETDMWAWLDRGILSTDNIQIDWLAARKDGVMGVALMNEDMVDNTVTITLGSAVNGGSSYTGTATVYDKNGACGTVEVVNGVFTITVPARELRAVKMNIATVTKPSFAEFEYDPVEEPTIGATVSKHTSGKGYTLQMTPDNYYAYVYITDMPSVVSSLSMTYTVGEETKTVTDDTYPFEFIIKVDDVQAEFNYELIATMVAGGTQSRGKGTLMTKALSDAKGITDLVATEQDVATGDIVEPTKEAKALKFDVFRLNYDRQAYDTKANMRFIVNKSAFPFEPNEKNVIGLPFYGKVHDNGTEVEFNLAIRGYEDRGSQCVVVVECVSALSKYKSTSNGEGEYTWEVYIAPVGSELKIPEGGGATIPSADSKEEVTAEAKAMKFDVFRLSYDRQAYDTKSSMRFVVNKSAFPFEPNEKNVIGLPFYGKVHDNGTVVDFNLVIKGYEDRGSQCIIIVDCTSEISAYTSTSNGPGEYTWEVYIAPVGSELIIPEGADDVTVSSGDIKEEVTSEAKALKFDKFKLDYERQACDTKSSMRFVVNKSAFPFEPNEKNVIGLPFYGKVHDNGTVVDFNLVIKGYEDRGSQCIIIVDYTSEISAYKSTGNGPGEYTWEIYIEPIK